MMRAALFSAVLRSPINSHAIVGRTRAHRDKQNSTSNVQDIAEANATIRELHSALSKTRYKLDVVEREQATRVQDVIVSLESLRSKLKQQEETKKTADARASQLAVLVQGLRSQNAALQGAAQSQDGQMLQLQRDNSELSQQLASSQASVQRAEGR
jgi:chromosome segregation ATPase